MEKFDYEIEMLQKMRQRTINETIQGVSVKLKPIPDVEETGVLDPRYYKLISSVASLTKWVPDKYLKLGPQKQTIEVLKKAFNLVKSKRVTDDNLRVDQITIRGNDNNLIPLRIYHPIEKQEQVPILYFIHGGGFFAGSLDVCDEFLRYLASKFNILVFSIDYRLAPTNPFPKGHEDCYAGLQWIIKNAMHYQGNTERIFVAGDSAGGNLAHYCVVKDIEEQAFKIKGQCLIYPVLNLAGVVDDVVTWDLNKYEMSEKQKDATLFSIQMIKNGGVDIMKGVLQTDVNNIYLTPYLFESTKIPPTLLAVGEYDFLRVETLAYAAKLQQRNCKVEPYLYKGMGHGFIDHMGYFPQSEDLAIEIATFISKYSV